MLVLNDDDDDDDHDDDACLLIMEEQGLKASPYNYSNWVFAVCHKGKPVA